MRMLRKRRETKKAIELARLIVALDDVARQRRSPLPRRSRMSLRTRFRTKAPPVWCDRWCEARTQGAPIFSESGRD